MKKIAILFLMIYLMMLGVYAEPTPGADSVVQPANAPVATSQSASVAPTTAPSHSVVSQAERESSYSTAQKPVQQATQPAPQTAPAATPVAGAVPTPTVTPPAPQEYNGNATISILFTSDIHGNFRRDVKTGTLGYSGIKAIASSIPNCILVDGGDYLSTNQFMVGDGLNSILELMNLTGYHVVGIGEADLENGVDVLRDIKSRAAFHMLSTNVTTSADRTPILESTKIIEIAGVKVGFFSLLNPELRLSASLQDLNNVYLEDASKTAQTSVNKLKEQGADVIVAISHMGNQGSSGVDQIAAFVSGIDFIFDGHDHKEESGRFIGDTLIVNPGYGGKQLIQLEIKFGGGKQITGLSTTQWFYEATEKLVFNEEIVALENNIIAQQNEFLNESVAESKVEIPYTEDMRYQSTPLGNFIADAYREKTKASVALIDAGSIAKGIPKGSITKADILAVLPQNDTIQTKKITPKNLKMALESGLSSLKTKEDGSVDPSSALDKFPHISGLYIDVNLNNEPGKRVVKMQMENGVNLNLVDDRTTLTIASNSMLLSGQNEYGIFEMQPVLEEYGTEGEALLEYLNYSGEYDDYQASRIRLTDNQESYTMLILTIAVVFAFLIMALILIIKLMTRVS